MPQRVTLVFEWEDGLEKPRFGAGDMIQGGTLVALQWGDALFEPDENLADSVVIARQARKIASLEHALAVRSEPSGLRGAK